MNETIKIFDTAHWRNQTDRVLLRMDDFDAMVQHLRREGFRISTVHPAVSDYLGMMGYLPSREPFYFGSTRYGESSIQVGKVGDLPFELVNGEYKRKDSQDLYSWSVWQRSLDDDRRDWIEADEAESIFRDFVQLYNDGVPTMPDELYAPRARMIGGLVVGFIADTLEQVPDVSS